jgi:hypothetical protein
MSHTPINDPIDDLIFELKDAVWCSRGDNASENHAAIKRVGKAETALKAHIAAEVEKARLNFIDYLDQASNNEACNWKGLLADCRGIVKSDLAALQQSQKEGKS